MPGISDETIFAALFALAKQAQGTDWNGAPLALQYSTRNWVPVQSMGNPALPALYQLDPLPEQQVRTGSGRSRRIMHALVDIRLSRQPQQTYDDTKVFSTIINNWKQSLAELISPSDYPTLGGLVVDVWVPRWNFDYGIGDRNLAVIEAMVELVTGG